MNDLEVVGECHRCEVPLTELPEQGRGWCPRCRRVRETRVMQR